MNSLFDKLLVGGVAMIAVVSTAYAAQETAAKTKDPLAPITKVLDDKSKQIDKKQAKGKTSQQSGISQTVQKEKEKSQEAQLAVAKFSQFPLQKSTAEYRFEGPLALEFMKVFNVGGSEKSRICYSVFPGKDNAWNLKIDIFDDETPVLQYRVQMDAQANVIKERITAIEYVDPQRTTVEKLTFRNTKKKRKTNIEDLTVSVEKQLVLGVSKVLRRYKNGKQVNELSVAPDEIITTLGQIVVFMGTVENIPSDGIKLRWTADGKPLPVLLKKTTNPKGGYICSVYRADNTLSDELKSKPILKFFLPVGKSFRYPDKIAMDINGTDLEIVKK